MKTFSMLAALAMIVMGSVGTQAQCNNCGGGRGGHGIGNAGDMTPPTCPDRGRYGAARFRAMARDRYSPQPVYAYSRAGIDAARQDVWNRNQSDAYPWHGGYQYWRYGQPTALVVPPTAAFQTEYNWGVAQTRSLPIYHQFGRDTGGLIEGDGSQFQPTPYWPSSTSQFGVYPVRGPWHH